jgi:hypothetical protein
VNAKPYRYLLDVRDRAVIQFDLPSDPPTTTRLLVLWDPDKDLRLLTIAEACRYRSPMMLATVVAVSETCGTIDFWTTSTDTAAVTRAIQGAADAALRPRDQWRVAPPRVIALKNGRPDWNSLPPNDPVRVAVQRHQLGVKCPDLGMVTEVRPS